MILLAPLQKIRITTTAMTTNYLPCVSDWVDTGVLVTMPGTAAVNSFGTGNVTIIAPPAAEVQRQVKTINIFNADTVVSTVTVSFYDGSNDMILVSVPLQVGETLQYTFQMGWRCRYGRLHYF